MYGTVRTVVWEEGRRKAPSYPIGIILARRLDKGWVLDAKALRAAMTEAFAASDAEGPWVWKDACEAVEVAQVLFLRKAGTAITARPSEPANARASVRGSGRSSTGRGAPPARRHWT